MLNAFYHKLHNQNLTQQYVTYFQKEIPKVVNALKSNSIMTYYQNLAKEYDQDVEARKMKPDVAEYNMKLIKAFILLTARYNKLTEPTLPDARYSISNDKNVKGPSHASTNTTQASPDSVESNIRQIYNAYMNSNIGKNKYDVNKDSLFHKSDKVFNKTESDSKTKLFTLGDKSTGPQTVYPNPALVNNKTPKQLTAAIGQDNVQKMYDVVDSSGNKESIDSNKEISRVDPITFREPLENIDKNELQQQVYRKGKIRTK